MLTPVRGSFQVNFSVGSLISNTSATHMRDPIQHDALLSESVRTVGSHHPLADILFDGAARMNASRIYYQMPFQRLLLSKLTKLE